MLANAMPSDSATEVTMCGSIALRLTSSKSESGSSTFGNRARTILGPTPIRAESE